MSESTTTQFRQTTRALRIMFYIAAILVFTVGITLNLLTTQTDRFFAWTIATPMTAAFLGAAYWSSCVLELLAAREKIWANARIAVPTVFVFTFLTLLITLLHLDKFHMTSPEMITRMGTWFWLFVYASVPIVLAILWFLQTRAPGIDPPRKFPPPQWMRVCMAIQAALLLALGIALLLVPQSIAPYWPWALTPLTGRAIGAWLFAIGIAGAQSLWENDLRRVRIAVISYVVIGVLELIALARFASDVRWDTLGAWFYVLFLLSFCVIGATAWNMTRQVSAND